jgi:ribosomal protein S18 acetylase RimI-like enzyme
MEPEPVDPASPVRANSFASASFRLRPAAPADAAFLLNLYRSTRRQEVSTWGWSREQADGFLEMQGQMEQRSRALQYPNADHRIVESEGRSVGRLLVDRTRERVLVVDVGLLPEAQGHGIGTALLNALVSEAEAGGIPLVLHVRRGNRAARLYQRLGFAVTGEDEVQLTMTFHPRERPKASTGLSRRTECQSRS